MLEVKNLTKIYKKARRGAGSVELKALDDVSFTVNSGEIVGLVGPNGAGKSTVIKCITTLARQTSGTITVDGHDTLKEPVAAVAEIGAIIENPDLYRDWSGEENLKYLLKLSGCPDKPDDMSEREYIKERTEKLLKIVGLYDRRKDKTAKYSLGMKQRLGIAQAIMNKPKLLILDEPANGLDPAGIAEMRELVVKLSHEMGIAALVSSHVLSEMQQLCDRFVVLKQGKVAARISADELSNGNILVLTVDDVVTAKDIIKEKFDLIAEIVASGKLEVKTDLPGGDIARELILGGVNVNAISKKEVTLEEIFMDITSGKTAQTENPSEKPSEGGEQ